jgi:hypothetical protein
MFFGIAQAWFFEFLVSRIYSLIYPYIDWKTNSFNWGKVDEIKDYLENEN